MIRRCLSFVTFLTMACLALGFTGRVWPLGDSLAVFRLPNVLLLGVLILTLQKTRFFYLALGVAILSALSIAINYIPQNIDDKTVYRLYQKNMSFLVEDRSALKADVLAAETDFITLQEVTLPDGTQANLEFISNLKTHFPYQLTCPSARVGGVAILSRWPSTEGHCFDFDGAGAMQVETPAGRIWVVSVHLYWPYPFTQAYQIKRLTAHIDSLEGPKIIAGDFNSVPWSYSVKALKRASGTRVSRPVINSFELPHIPLTIPIDHVLLPIGAKAKTERRDKKGSDHYGLLVTFNLP